MTTKVLLLQVVLQFRQQIAHAADLETYQVEVIKAPGRGWGGPLVPTGLDDAQIQAIRVLYRSFLERQRSNAGRAFSEKELEPLRTAGTQLFRALPETVQQRLRQAQALARKKGRGLELILGFDPNAQSLANLPWELLHDPDRRCFLALNGGLVRQWLLPAVVSLDPAYHPRSIVGVWAEPDDVAPLTDRRAYRPAPGCDDGFIWLSGADSLLQLEHTLATGNFDGLHIVAHGRAGENWSDLSLALVNANGHVHWLSPDQLVTFIAGYPSIQFVYLDVCSSGQSSLQDFASGGLARDLIGSNVSLVIAMQDEISQAAAGLTAQVFYQEWLQGATAAQAMAAARRAVRVQQDDPANWSIPILYLQQRSSEERNPRVDDWLNRIPGLLSPTNIICLTLLLWIGRLSFILAQAPIDDSTSWLTLLPYIAESILLSVLAAFAMQVGQKQLREKYFLVGRQWLEVLTEKYLAAFIWGFMAWVFIWLVWLGVNWSGWGTRLDAGLRQVLWIVALSGVAGANYLGARQAIRQKRLFIHLARSPLRIRDWFLLFALAFLPLGLAGILGLAWRWLATTPAGFYLVIAMLLVLVLALKREQTG